MDAHPNLIDIVEYGCDDEDIAELEVALGHAVPEDLEEFLRVTDGGMLRGPTRAIHMASAQEMAQWALSGVTTELEAVPFAQDESGTILVCDTEGDWGGDKGAIYKVAIGKRHIRGYPVQDAVRIAGGFRELLDHLATGKDAW